jgi:4-amino-4-deoxy-L-arabinose transferase-like glycosyltransferase
LIVNRNFQQSAEDYPADMRIATAGPPAKEKRPPSGDSGLLGLGNAPAHGSVPYLLLLAATLVCLLPFSGRAFSTDDPLFIWTAQQIVHHPLDPYRFQVNWNKTEQPMSEVTQNPPLASYYMAVAAEVVGWSERALHLAFLLPTIALVLGVYRLAKRFTGSPGLAAMATLLAPALLVSACSVMCDPMMLALWIWATIFWIEGLDSEKPVYLAASALLIAASELAKYFGVALVPLLFAYTLARRRRLGFWACYLLVPVGVLMGYEFVTTKLYGHGLLATAADFSRNHRLWTHASKGARTLIALSYLGGSALPALLVAPFVWSRKQILVTTLSSGVAAVFIMRGLVRLGLTAGSPQAFAARNEHWAIISIQLVLFIAGGISALALAIADYRRERNADSLLLLLWVVGTFWFTAYLNWTVNARSVLPMVPVVGILIPRRLERLDKNPSWRFKASVTAALLACGIVSIWLARVESESANSGRTAALLVREKTAGNDTLWFLGHSGFQYYMQMLGARPYNWSNPQTRPGDFLVIPYSKVWPEDVTAQFRGTRENIEIPMRGHASTTSPELGAGFYHSYWSILPYAFGPVPTEKYAIVRLAQ